jgi:hypothetical protein
MELAHKEAARRTAHHVDYMAWVKEGLVGGFYAGLVFAVFAMIVSAIAGATLFTPLRMIAATLLGPQALTPEVSLGVAALVGVLIHVVYSVLLGAVLAFIVSLIPALRSSGTAIVLTVSLLGLITWLINFYAIAPAAGWLWFPEGMNQFWHGFVAHTFAYGTVLGWYLASRRGRYSDTPTSGM